VLADTTAEEAGRHLAVEEIENSVCAKSRGRMVSISMFDEEYESTQHDLMLAAGTPPAPPPNLRR